MWVEVALAATNAIHYNVIDAQFVAYNIFQSLDADKDGYVAAV